MLTLRLLACLVTVAALSPADTLAERLRHALGPGDSANIAVQALQAGDFARVERILQDPALRGNVSRAELLALCGAVEFLQSDMTRALQSFHDARALGALKENDEFTYGMALVKTGNHAGARAVLSALAEQHPGRGLFLFWLGRIDYEERRYESAIAKFTQATRLEPNSARIWDSLGLAFDMSGSQDEALSAFSRAVQLNRTEANTSALPPHNLGYLLLRMERPTEAEAALRESLCIDPGFAQAHYHLGRVLEKETKKEEAAEEYRRAISLDRNGTDACYALAMLYRRSHNEAKADQMFAEYRKRRAALQEPDSGVPN